MDNDFIMTAQQLEPRPIAVEQYLMDQSAVEQNGEG